MCLKMKNDKTIDRASQIFAKSKIFALKFLWNNTSK